MEKIELKKAFLLALAARKAEQAKLLLERLKAADLPFIALNISHKDGIYTVDGKGYNKAEIQSYLNELEGKYKIRFVFIDNSKVPDKNSWIFWDRHVFGSMGIAGMVIF